MAQLQMNGAVGVDLYIEYTPSNGKVTGFTVVNSNSYSVLGRATLSDGRVFSQVFGTGTTTVSFPPNVVSVTFSAAGEPTFVGLASTTLLVPAP